MTPVARRYSYEVERDLRTPGRVDIALVRREQSGGLLRFGRHERQPLVMFHRSFNSMLELSRLEAYAAQLEHVARHAGKGTFGCFIDTSTSGGVVRITLYERWFDGEKLHCESLATRDFDAEDEQTLVCSAEFVASLQAWAQERNDEREASYLDAGLDEQVKLERAIDRAAAATELAQILASEAGTS
jgi:hypothetical protein